MATGLNVSDFVRVDVSINPTAAPTRNFGASLVVGPSNVIDVGERLRPFTGLDQVAQTFGTSAPEYQSANLYFAQEPQPALLYIGRWAQTAAPGVLHGASLSTSQQLLSNFTGVTAGALRLTIDGTQRDITGINLSTALNLNAVANLVQTAIAAVASGVTVTWDAVLKRFNVQSGMTGAGSSVSYAGTPPSGTNLGPIMHLTSVDASTPVVGVAAESLVSCIATFADISNDWYSIQVATGTPPADADVIAAAVLVEGLNKSHTFGITTTNANVLDITNTTELASQLKALGLSKTFVQFSRNSPYAATSLFGRAATVDFQGSNTTITLAYKQEPGVVAESLSESQFQALLAKNVNVFTQVENGTAVLFPGKMINGDYFDERHGLDWFQNELQTAWYNLLYQTPTKVPQTDAGMDLLKAVAKKVCARAVDNGLIAPGLWTGPGFGSLKTGDTLSAGYYIYAPLVQSQSDADRAARKSVSFQIALKMAGAVHFVASAVLANR
ncbi:MULTISPECIES: DUF3383 domain-containing protein [Methylobacterium]|uniref:DUF3383 domain-containing protein n=6 Tax=Pseudomonadota TaxID=1224 RepID=A0ABQ4T0L2_9HYPH|nr:MULTISPECIES: DUF3383 domain-containing protein [Methylobacterium]PIU06912.1 MAG: hypothetical protein COT56_07205 [Methylobacterium sp. CG09_land_8_20_14_0_10_71_15]PIU16124.1 MAG: hypothetical protein COT28_01525 [Methylobacterium sp. CG08_land_8_20_14_0_20_71_15]GBU18026.1 hypothetical protein AwMethylo_22410 [Methylobacterium sp.]GJE08632.1 hypothetical protein AOPFMNJM_3975 [Methylobacterium jeotgali]